MHPLPTASNHPAPCIRSRRLPNTLRHASVPGDSQTSLRRFLKQKAPSDVLHPSFPWHKGFPLPVLSLQFGISHKDFFHTLSLSVISRLSFCEPRPQLPLSPLLAASFCLFLLRKRRKSVSRGSRRPRRSTVSLRRYPMPAGCPCSMAMPVAIAMVVSVTVTVTVTVAVTTAAIRIVTVCDRNRSLTTICVFVCHCFKNAKFS